MKGMLGAFTPRGSQVQSLSHPPFFSLFGLSAKSIETRVYRAGKRLAEQLAIHADTP